MKEENEIDKLFRDGLQGQPMDPPKEIWASLEDSIPPPDGSKWLLLGKKLKILIIAAISTAAVTVVGILSSKKDKAQEQVAIERNIPQTQNYSELEGEDYVSENLESTKSKNQSSVIEDSETGNSNQQIQIEENTFSEETPQEIKQNKNSSHEDLSEYYTHNETAPASIQDEVSSSVSITENISIEATPNEEKLEATLPSVSEEPGHDLIVDTETPGPSNDNKVNETEESTSNAKELGQENDTPEVSDDLVHFVVNDEELTEHISNESNESTSTNTDSDSIPQLGLTSNQIDSMPILDTSIVNVSNNVTQKLPKPYEPSKWSLKASYGYGYSFLNVKTDASIDYSNVDQFEDENMDDLLNNGVSRQYATFAQVQLQYQLKEKLKIYSGIGYQNNEFNFEQNVDYEHDVQDPSAHYFAPVGDYDFVTSELPVPTNIQDEDEYSLGFYGHYNVEMYRVPIGIEYQLFNWKKFTLNLDAGIEIQTGEINGLYEIHNHDTYQERGDDHVFDTEKMFNLGINGGMQIGFRPVAPLEISIETRLSSLLGKISKNEYFQSSQSSLVFPVGISWTFRKK